MTSRFIGERFVEYELMPFYQRGTVQIRKFPQRRVGLSSEDRPPVRAEDADFQIALLVQRLDVLLDSSGFSFEHQVLQLGGHEVCFSGRMLYGYIPDERRLPVYNEIGENAEEEDDADEKDPEKFPTKTFNENVSLTEECNNHFIVTLRV
jgi:hypothetical protein